MLSTSRRCLFKCTKQLAIKWKFFSSEAVEHRTCPWGHETERGQTVMGKLFVCLQLTNVYVYVTETTQLWAVVICDSATE